MRAEALKNAARYILYAPPDARGHAREVGSIEPRRTREEDFKIEERKAYGNHKSDRVKDDTMWGSSSVSIEVPGVRPGVSQVPSCRSCKTLSCPRAGILRL